MNVSELAQRCALAISLRGVIGLPVEDASILITTPKGWKAPPRFPRRRLAQVKEDGTRVGYVKAVRVLAWLAANGMVRIKSEGED
jgi:hypothetical protein